MSSASPAPSEAPPASSPRVRHAVVQAFLEPYAQLAFGALLVTASELLLRRGAMDVTHGTGLTAVFGVTALASMWTWGGIVCYVLSFVCWIHVLRFVPLARAFALINVVHVLVPLGAWLMLGEAVNARRWVGITLVVLGVLLVARPAAKAEEEL